MTAPVAGIVVAAGRGERFGSRTPKALIPLAGRPMLMYAVESLAAAGAAPIVVAAPADRLAEVRAAVGDAATVVAGGDNRQQSVCNALGAIGPDAHFVLVHDAARALAPAELADAVIAALHAGADAVVPGLPVVDTIKAVEGNRVTATINRDRLVVIQTPQGFATDLLRRAHAAAGDGAASDDAGLVEAIGGEVVVVPGVVEAMKITRPLDLALAEAMLAGRA